MLHIPKHQYLKQGDGVNLSPFPHIGIEQFCVVQFLADLGYLEYKISFGNTNRKFSK